MKVRATLETSSQDYLSLELEIGEQVVIGYDVGTSTDASPPDYNLGELFTSEALEDVATRHATLAYRHGDFWIEALNGHRTQIGQYVVVPGQAVRVVDGDSVRFGDAELGFRIHQLGPNPSPVTRASVTI